MLDRSVEVIPMNRKVFPTKLAQALACLALLLLPLAGCKPAGRTPTPTAPRVSVTASLPRPTTTLAPSLPTPTEEIAGGLAAEEMATLSSLQQVDDHPLYTILWGV